MAEVRTIPYKPREHQLAIHQATDNSRFTVAVCHRRFGKTVAAINELIKLRSTAEGRLLVMPTSHQLIHRPKGLLGITS
jgi:hypothetical protein